MQKICLICGMEYSASPSRKRTTCGRPECVSERRRQTHVGKPHPWGEAAKARRKGRIPEALTLGTEAARKSPLAGPFETNRHAKIWRLVSPSGERYEVKNLNFFAREHFGAGWLNFAAGIRILKRSLEGKTARPHGSHKGWRLDEDKTLD